MYLGEKLNVSVGQQLHICAEFYFYNSRSTSFNPENQLIIYNDRRGLNALSNFTISVTPSGNVTMGGARNQNEGYLALYTITSNPDSNGTYGFNFLADLAPQFLGTPPGGTSTAFQVGGGTIAVEGCGTEFELASGNGLPDYATTATFCTGASGGSAVNGELYPPDMFVVEILGWATSNG